jgi:endogenous inhibitor of DNA gyrase (YacG/DUF329 family)
MNAEKKRSESNLVRLRPPRKCPICGKPAVSEAWPFCSTRCAEVDLHHWLSGQYRVPAVQDEDEAEGEGDTEPPPDHHED